VSVEESSTESSFDVEEEMKKQEREIAELTRKFEKEKAKQKKAKEEWQIQKNEKREQKAQRVKEKAARKLQKDNEKKEKHERKQREAADRANASPAAQGSKRKAGEELQPPSEEAKKRKFVENQSHASPEEVDHEGMHVETNHSTARGREASADPMAKNPTSSEKFAYFMADYYKQQRDQETEKRHASERDALFTKHMRNF
jgi:hypothetical protein